MNTQDITTLLDFNFWADEKILSACEQLPPEQFTRPVEPNPGWSSLRGVLVHNLDTEFGWRTVLQPDVEDVLLKEEDFEDVAALRARWEEEKAAWLNFVGGLTDADLEKRTSEDGPRAWETIVHVVSHGIQHRAEAAMVLTGLGHSPGELDFAVFLKKRTG